MTAARGDYDAAAESSLVMLAAAGDDRAFGALVRRRQGATRLFLRRLCGDAALADDLSQETFFLAWKGLGRLRAPGAFGGWLRQVALNVWLAHARKLALPLDEADEEVAEEPAPVSTGERLDLERALARLKPAERACVVLCHAEGLSHAETAEATGLPLGTVKSHVARGAARLRVLLEGGAK